jgi:hypothetical protein
VEFPERLTGRGIPWNFKFLPSTHRWKEFSKFHGIPATHRSKNFGKNFEIPSTHRWRISGKFLSLNSQVENFPIFAAFLEKKHFINVA